MTLVPPDPDVILTAHRARSFALAVAGDERFTAQPWNPYWGGVVLPQPIALAVGPLAAVTFVWIAAAALTCVCAGGRRTRALDAVLCALLATPFLASWPVHVGLVSWVAGAPLALLALRRLAWPRGRRARIVTALLVALASMCHALWAPVLVGVGLFVARRRRDVVALAPALAVSAASVAVALTTRAIGEPPPVGAHAQLLAAWTLRPAVVEALALGLALAPGLVLGLRRLRVRGWRRQRVFLAAVGLLVAGALAPSLTWTIAIGERLAAFGAVLLVASMPSPPPRARALVLGAALGVLGLVATSIALDRARSTEEMRGFADAVAAIPRGAVIAGAGPTDRAALLAALLADGEAYDFAMVESAEPPLNLPVVYAPPLVARDGFAVPAWLTTPTHAIVRRGDALPSSCARPSPLASKHLGAPWRAWACR